MVKVVFQVELVEVERYNELHEVGRQVGFSKETDRKVRPVGLGQLAKCRVLEGYCMTYRKTCLVPNFIVAARGKATSGEFGQAVLVGCEALGRGLSFAWRSRGRHGGAANGLTGTDFLWDWDIEII